jgi:hypothetical protein
MTDQLTAPESALIQLVAEIAHGLTPGQEAELARRLAGMRAADPWTPSGKDYDRSIHSNPDAAAWADFFVATFPGLADKRDTMLGWFANAMMAMHDSVKAAAPSSGNDKLRRLRTEFDAILKEAIYQCSETGYLHQFEEVFDRLLAEPEPAAADGELIEALHRAFDVFASLVTNIGNGTHTLSHDYLRSIVDQTWAAIQKWRASR